jgi:predicted RNA-binding protein YlqC (UPF0109 family)
MKDLLEYILKTIVNNPKEVEVTVDEPTAESMSPEEAIAVVHVKVNEEDKGLIIGKQGKTINAIRTLLAIKARQKVVLKVE